MIIESPKVLIKSLNPIIKDESPRLFKSSEESYFKSMGIFLEIIYSNISRCKNIGKMYGSTTAIHKRFRQTLIIFSEIGSY